MATKSSRTREMAEEAEEGVTILGNPRADNPLMPLDDIDTEESWDSWIEDLKTSESSGTVRVYKLPVDSEGNAIVNKGGRQIYLMSCPHQQYSFDELIEVVKSGFFRPGESATLRIQGTRSGRRGIMFNRIVPVQRIATATETPESGGPILGVIQAMQNQTRQQGEMLERILTSGHRPELTPQKSALETIKEWTAILTPILTPAILAVINRPAPKSDLEGLIGAMVKLKEFTSGNDGGGDDENTTLGIVKAVAGPGLQLLNTLAQNHAPVANTPRGRQIPARIGASPPRSIPAGSGVGPSQSPPVQPPAPPTEPINATVLPENDAMLAQLAPQIEKLSDLAEQNADPAEVAKLVMDMLPANEQVDDQLYALVSDVAAFNRLALLAPKMKLHAEWFERLRLAMLAEFAEESPEAKSG